jgi:diguanylate cyclase (GGDEF)-like protein/hemerythrin-like metal-binding protein
MSRQAKLITLWGVVLFFTSMLWAGGFLIKGRIVGEEQAQAERSAAVRASAVVSYTQQHLQQARALLSAVRQFHGVSRSLEDTERFIDGLGFDKSVIENIYLIDAEGRVAISHNPASADTSVADRDYFAFHRDPANRGAVHVSKVEKGRITGELLFRVSLRLNDADGQFGGVVLATVNPAAFNTYFQQLNQDGVDRVIVLMGSQDHVRRARLPTPRDDQWSESIEADVWAMLTTQAKGRYVRTSSFDQISRTYIYEALAEWPLVVAVAFSSADVAAQVNPRIEQMLVPAVASTVFVLMLALVGTGMVVSRERLVKANEQLDNLYKLMRAEATHDKLTGLPNRTLFFERLSRDLARARRADKPLALFFLDLDGFKRVNDQHGHDAGDAVLIAVARRWQQTMRETDTVARIGGDEFAIILPNADRMEDLQAIATKLIKLTGQVIDLPNQAKVQVGASIGISLYPAHGTEIDTLIAAADTAMYQSKARGKNGYTVSDTEPLAGHETTDWVVFTDAHLTGVAVIDDQHRELVRQVNEINRAIVSNLGSKVVQGLFDALFAFTKLHFDTENRLMAQVNYPARVAHEQAHAALLDELGQLNASLSSGGELLVLQTIKDWLLNHIEHADRPLGAFVAGFEQNNSK